MESELKVKVMVELDFELGRRRDTSREEVRLDPKLEIDVQITPRRMIKGIAEEIVSHADLRS